MGSMFLLPEWTVDNKIIIFSDESDRPVHANWQQGEEGAAGLPGSGVNVIKLFLFFVNDVTAALRWTLCALQVFQTILIFLSKASSVRALKDAPLWWASALRVYLGYSYCYLPTFKLGAANFMVVLQGYVVMRSGCLKSFPGQNTPAYFASASMTKTKNVLRR
jgi:hypothetical protein